MKAKLNAEDHALSEARIKPVLLVESIEIKDKTDRNWFWSFLSEIFSSPDLDYSQFVQLESKKTRAKTDFNRWY